MTEQRIPRPAIGATAKRVLGPVLRTHLDRGHRQGLRALRSGAPPDGPRGGVGAGVRACAMRGTDARARGEGRRGAVGQGDPPAARGRNRVGGGEWEGGQGLGGGG